MKTLFRNILILSAVIAFAGCKNNDTDINYTAPVSITYAGVNADNMVTVDKGVMSYNASIAVKSSLDLYSFEVYNADARTGARGTLIAESAKQFEEGVTTYSYQYTVPSLTENKCIQVVVTDAKGFVYQRNLLVKITPAVLFSESAIMETADSYYGVYYATWLDGRVYMKRNGGNYAGQIDFSLGNAVVTTGGAKVPAFVSPAKRADYGLMNIAGVQETKFALTSMTKAQYDAVGRVDATPISSLADPTLDAVELSNGKVYLFKTTNGKKGLVYIASVASKTGTIETAAGTWTDNTTYQQVTLTTKTIAW